MTANDGVVSSRSAAVLEVTIDRAEANNALDLRAMARLGATVAEAGRDPTVRVVVIRSAAGKAFCAGADLRELSSSDHAGVARILAAGQRVYRSIETLGKPVVAAVDGYALGGGFELCLASSLVVASDRSRFGLPEVGLGLIPGYGGTQRLTRMVGKQRALRVMLLGDMLSAVDAFDLGLLAFPPVPADELDARVEDLVGTLSSRSPAAMADVLEAVDAAQHDGLSSGLRRETMLASAAPDSPDGREGIAAFLEKRAPTFAGHVSGDPLRPPDPPDGDDRG